jgi:CRISPR-associated Csx2 family protein
MTTLITFLGKGRVDNTTGYRVARYRFPDGWEDRTAYFGLALARWLDAKRLILLGTSASMWDVLIEHLATAGDEEALRIELMDAVATGRVDDALLARVKPIVERAVGRACVLAVIPHGRDDVEQQAILEVLSRQIRDRERVAIDVTHGYRHLSMIGFAAARYLRTTHRSEIDGLYYGALDMTMIGPDGFTPVLRLDGLERIQRWVESFSRFDASGDYAAFADLLEGDGLAPDLARRLERAFYFERTLNVRGASLELKPLVDALRNRLSGPAELFRDRLRRALEWSQGDDLADQQRKLAFQAWRRDDFLRAAILGIESFLTRETIDAGRDPMDFRAREEIDKRFQQALKDGEHPDWKRKAYWLLKNVRNAMAHGTPPDRKEHQQLLKNVDRLREELEKTLNRLTHSP